MRYLSRRYVVVEIYENDYRSIFVTENKKEALEELSRVRRVGDYHYEIFEEIYDLTGSTVFNRSNVHVCPVVRGRIF